MVKAWGYHAIIDIAKCKPRLIRCPHNITAFSHELVKRIDMKAYGLPQVVHFGVDDKKGYTLTQLIETSCISAHFSEDTNSAFIDIFSCKPYNISTAELTVREFFAPEIVWKKFLERPVPEESYMK